VAGSLAEAHGIGLIHRDVKPANLILVPERGGAPDVAKVVDFGLVKTLDRGGEGQMGLTQDDHIAGTPLYLSPEAITAPERVGARSDLYSLGCIGYYLLTGQRVFEGRNVVEVCSHHLHSAPTPPSERLGRPVPDSLSALLMACLEKEPERRPRSARELLLSLHACRDVPAWTEEEARAWWSRAEGRRRPPAAASLSSVGTMSILRRADVARDA
jgi:eukaryotic-like serine/threonine-protein kinase